MIYYTDYNKAERRCREINRKRKEVAALVEGIDGLGYYVMSGAEAAQSGLPYTIYT